MERKRTKRDSTKTVETEAPAAVLPPARPVKSSCNCQAVGGFVYFLGFIATFVYYLQQNPSFWFGVFRFLESLIWPAFFIYKIAELLKI